MPVETENSAQAVPAHAFKTCTVNEAQFLPASRKHRTGSRHVLLFHDPIHPQQRCDVFMECPERREAQTVLQKNAHFQQNVIGG